MVVEGVERRLDRAQPARSERSVGRKGERANPGCRCRLGPTSRDVCNGGDRGLLPERLLSYDHRGYCRVSGGSRTLIRGVVAAKGHVVPAAVQLLNGRGGLFILKQVFTWRFIHVRQNYPRKGSPSR